MIICHGCITCTWHFKVFSYSLRAIQPPIPDSLGKGRYSTQSSRPTLKGLAPKGNLSFVLGLNTPIFLTSFFRSKLLACPTPLLLFFFFSCDDSNMSSCPTWTVYCHMPNTVLRTFSVSFRVSFPLTGSPSTLLGQYSPHEDFPSLTCHNKLHGVAGLRPDGKVIITAAIVSSITNAHWNDQKVCCAGSWVSPDWVTGCNFIAILVKNKTHVFPGGGAIESHSRTRSDHGASPCLEERLGVQF